MVPIDCGYIAEFFGDQAAIRQEIGESKAAGLTFEDIEEHIRKCPLCSSQYGLDFLVAKNIRTLPLSVPPGISAAAVKIARRKKIERQAIRLGVMFVGLLLVGFLIQTNMASILNGIVKVFTESWKHGFASAIISETMANVRALLKLVSFTFLRPLEENSIPFINYLIASIVLSSSIFVILAMYLFKKLGLAGELVVERGQANGKTRMVSGV
ncbi:MAG: hypothetical protein ACUVUU_05000 [bacterium]